MPTDSRRRLVAVELVDEPPPDRSGDGSQGLVDHADPSVVRAGVDGLLALLADRLDGDGPALAPLAPGPEREQILTLLRTDLALERDDIAVVLPTSGSTGEPKGALLPGSALLHSARATLAALGGPGRWLLALPPTRVAGLQVLVRSLVAGTTPAVMAGRFTVEAFTAATDRLGRSGAGSGSPARRYTALVPTQLGRLLDADPAAVDALRSYDAVLVGGGASSAALLDRARSAGVRVVTTYGMTETCGGCVYDGRPLAGVDLDIDEASGLVRIGGATVFAGYRRRPDLTATALVDGRHLTSDLGRLRPDGTLEILGRADDVVVSGGVNVPLLAVERAVASCPGVAEAAAVGVPDAEWGSLVRAYVVLRPGAGAPALADVRDHVSATHPRAYAPREVVVVDALPLLPSGKVDRSALRATG
ncbi:AMP-binding protein [Actinopolymorpha singaporensis]|uniref:O-succinylbenzoic acid--CoA ligase n=1 Tax=Actinopolymorpha singaporensis TaxID=117157 RepID=A0A1H1QQT9_9ACTN|nr:AMP-binding protein [Actinopolymorpha singaporensis]SDS25830.1 O-succinylbenzoic acid--CoA ligase [Actinopolymorpha singaporensis]